MLILLDEDVLKELEAAKRLRSGPRSLTWICAQFGIEKGRDGHYSRTNYKHYIKIGQILQRLKRQGKVVYVGGKNAGWRLA